MNLAELKLLDDKYILNSYKRYPLQIAYGKGVYVYKLTVRSVTTGKSAEKYDVSIHTDWTTTVDVMIHNIALHAVSTRVPLIPSL